MDNDVSNDLHEFQAAIPEPPPAAAVLESSETICTPSQSDAPVDAGGRFESGIELFGSFTTGLTVLAVLIAYLCVSVGLRMHTAAGKRRARDARAPGRAFDVSAVEPRIQRVRHDYIAAAQDRLHHFVREPGLIGAARRFVRGLAYFQRYRHEQEAPRHDS